MFAFAQLPTRKGRDLAFPASEGHRSRTKGPTPCLCPLGVAFSERRRVQEGKREESQGSSIFPPSQAFASWIAGSALSLSGKCSSAATTLGELPFLDNVLARPRRTQPKTQQEETCGDLPHVIETRSGHTRLGFLRLWVGWKLSNVFLFVFFAARKKNKIQF